MNSNASLNFKYIIYTIRLIFIFVTAFSVNACGVEDLSLNPNSAKFLYVSNSSIPDKIIDVSLGPIINQYMRDAKEYGLNTQKASKHLQQVVFFEGLIDGKAPPLKGYQNEHKSLAGLCVKWQEISPILHRHVKTYLLIYFDASYWDKVDTHEFKSLAYHELSHCLLNAVHADQSGEDAYISTVKKRMTKYLESESAAGRVERFELKDLRAEDVPAEGLTAFEGFYYSKTLLERLKTGFTKDYNDEMIMNHHIMSEYMEADEDFWRDNWDHMANELFTSLGGTLRSERASVTE